MQAHNAFNDAIYTARVASALDLEEGIRNYEELNGVLWHSMHSTKDFFPTFRTAEKALADPKLKSLLCPVCNEKLTVPEFTIIDEKNAECLLPTKHGTLSVKLKLMRSQRKSYYIRRTIRFI